MICVLLPNDNSMTSRNLLIMRHAKSDWTANLADFDRPLNRRGLKDAKKMGIWLKKQKFCPELVISSPAQRTRQTIEIVCRQLGKDNTDIVWDERIYEASLNDLLKVVSKHGKNAGCLLLVGHNPGLDHLVNHLSKDPVPHNAGGKLMTTAAIAVLEFGKAGISVRQGSGRLMNLARPKEL